MSTQRSSGRRPEDITDLNDHRTMLERARANDPRAIADLMARFGPIVRGYAQRERRSADVDDIEQEVWIRLWTHRDRIDEPERLPGWLRQVTHRVVIDAMRKERAVVMAAVPEQFDPPHSDPTSMTLLVTITRRAVREAVGRLTDAHREVIEPLLLEEPPPLRELSQAINRSEGAIGPTRGRALERLRRDPRLLAVADRPPRQVPPIASAS